MHGCTSYFVKVNLHFISDALSMIDSGMPRTSAEHPPRQARSRESLLLLDAAEIVLVKYGPEGATLPRIAKQARLSPASVYRRFRDKEALMQALVRSRRPPRKSTQVS